MTSRPRVLLLAPTRSYRVEPFMAAARHLGVDVVVGTDRCHSLAEEWGIPLALDFRQPDEAAEQILAAGPFQAVVPTDDATAVVASVAAGLLGLPTNPPSAAIAARNKGLMRDCLRSRGVAVPPHRVVEIDAVDRILDASFQVGGPPVVLKPLLLSGSRGVIRADDADAIIGAFHRIRTILATPDHRPAIDPDSRRILVEKFVPGREIAVEGILRDRRLQVVAIFDKPDPLDGPFFEETIYVTPSSLEPAVQGEVAALVERATAALGLRRGPVHAELRIDGGSIVVIEVAGRSIGGLCSRTVELVTGCSLEEMILREALGHDNSAVRSMGAAGVMMLPIPRRGLLRRVTGVERALAVSGILSVDITAPLANPIIPLPEGSSYLGFIFARGDHPRLVEDSLRQAHRHLSFDIAPDLVLREPSAVPTPFEPLERVSDHTATVAP